MNFSPTNVLAGTFALLLHGLVVGAFFVDWGSETRVEVQSDRPYFIPAQMVAENPHTAKQEKAAAVARQQAQQRRETIARETAAKLKRESEKLKQQQLDEERAREQADLAKQSRLDRLKAEQLANEARLREEQAAKEARLKAEQLALADTELQKLINAELGAIEAVTDAEKAMAYVGQIQADIIQNWSRPPSARNGMQAILKVFLVPTGEVVDVAILTTSGNDAFDRSAIQAVRKVRRFDVPKDAKLFESKFREFEVLFRPEDLRL